MQYRIRWRVALPFLILLAVVISTITQAGIQHFRREEAQFVQSHLLNMAEIIAEDLQSRQLEPGDFSGWQALATSTSQKTGIHITILDISGHLLATSLPFELLPSNTRELPAVSEALLTGRSSEITGQFLAAAISLPGDDSLPGSVLHLQVPKSNFQADLNYIYWLSAGIFFTSALLIVLILSILNDQSQKPVEKLTIAAQQISMGNFNNLEFPEPIEELSALNTAMKDLASRLGEQIDQLTSERAMLSSVLNQMTDGVLITSADGEVQLINPTAERLFNITHPDGLGRSIVEVLRYHQLVELWRAARDGERQSTMLEIGPQHIFLQAVGIPLKSALPGSTMLLFQDLTQLRRLETVRRDFISNVSHELRTPLASLKALAETLQEGALDDPPAARRFIERMDTEIDSLTQLVNELLELSRIESGKVPLSFNRVTPCDLIQPAYERMILQVERAGLELIFDCHTELPAVFADPDRITQVLINLIHNALKFTPQGGKITVSAYQDGGQIIFFVRDTGVGIARIDLGRIFERFYKADRARTGGGMGLGLSIARHMIESHGGYIWAESEVGEGSTFNFSLPTA